MDFSKFKHHDWILTILILLLLAIGLLMIFATTFNASNPAQGAGTVQRQAVFIIIGLGVYFALSISDYSWLQTNGMRSLIYGAILLLLIYVKFFGSKIANTNRWIDIGFFSLQPSEYAKIAIIILTAGIFAQSESALDEGLYARPPEKITSAKSWRDRAHNLWADFSSYFPFLRKLAISLVLILPYLILILIQPALGNTIITLLLWVMLILILVPNQWHFFNLLLQAAAWCLIFLQFLNITFVQENFLINLNLPENLTIISGLFVLILTSAMLLNNKTLQIILTPLICLGLILGFVVSWNNGLTQYQKLRVQTYVQGPESDPTGTGYQVRQSKIAIGSGMLLGRGFLQGSQSSLQILTQAHTDFIFAALAEQFGLVGAGLVLLLYLIIILRVISIATSSGNHFGKILAMGVAILLLLHVFINIGMNLGVLPVTGIPLPLMSYGGSAILMTLIALGLVQSVNAGKKSIDTAQELMLRSPV